ncbi:MAG: HAD-IIIA family hydrolase [bacterium]
MKKCIFFDRDGIVNQSPGPGYVERWEDFHILPEFVDILRIVTELGYVAIIITNQRGVARGIMTLATLEDMHQRLRATLKEQYGFELLDIFTCTHNREDNCDCRKPKPGMLLAAAQKHSIDLSRSWMIGDSPKDAEAGRAAGCHTILVNPTAPPDLANLTFGSMAELRQDLRKVLQDSELRTQDMPTANCYLPTALTAILFDIDGTLLDMRGVGVKSFVRSLKTIFDIEDDLSRISFAGSTDLDVLRQVMEHHKRTITAADFDRFHAQLPIELETAVHQAELTLFPGVKALLEALSAAPGVILGLVTGNVESCAWIKLRQFDLHHHFVLGAFGNEHADRNEIARLAMKRVEARLRPGQTIQARFLIGDTPNDIAAAHAIDAVSIAVATGKFTVEALQKAGAMVVLPDLSDTNWIVELVYSNRTIRHRAQPY